MNLAAKATQAFCYNPPLLGPWRFNAEWAGPPVSMASLCVIRAVSKYYITSRALDFATKYLVPLLTHIANRKGP